MGRGNPADKKKIKRRPAGKRRTEQSALFASSPAIVYHGTGQETKRDPAFIFNDSGKDRYIRDPDA